MVFTIKHFFERYERYISPAAFFAGFLWDNFTLRRIDLLFENVVLLSQLFISGAVIFLLNTRLKGRLVNLFPFMLQFSFGALFSAFFVFYSRSASLSSSWFFLLFLLALLIGNEVFRKRYQRLVFQLSIYFIAVFSYSIFAVPILLGKIGAGVFVVSSFVSLALFGLFAFVLSFLIKLKLQQVCRPLIIAVVSIFLSFHILYFANIIPPIPLSLKEGGIYHFVSRTEAGQYVVYYEQPPLYLFFKDFNPVFHWVPGADVYSYSAVFAPTKINTKIYHDWSYFDEKNDKWITVSHLGFDIIGGRDGGYRGYTMKNFVFPGKWRVDVITERGQILGRIKFKIVEVDSSPSFETGIK